MRTKMTKTVQSTRIDATNKKEKNKNEGAAAVVKNIFEDNDEVSNEDMEN